MATLDADLRQFLFAEDPEPIQGVELKRLSIYRRMVRASLTSAVRDCLELSEHFAGSQKLNFWLSEWLEVAPPVERFYWMLPLEFANWLVFCYQESEPFLTELVQWEALKLGCLNAPDFADEGAVLHPSVRLGVYRYPVFTLSEADDAPARLPEPTFILLYRVNEQCHWLRLPPQVAQLLSQLNDGASLEDAMTWLESLYGQIDRSYLRSELVGLRFRGLLLGDKR